MESHEDEEKFACILRHSVEELKSDESFFVADLSNIRKKFELWKKKLPRVQPFYAVKANSEIPVLRLMLSLGAGFDCASKNEIEKLLSIGTSPSQIIFAHTIKITSHLKYAKDHGVDLMTFDTEEELLKIKEHFPTARLLIRFMVPDVKTPFPWGGKYGCDISQCRELLEISRRLELSVIGTSFHIGGSCSNPQDYSKAIRMAKEIFDLAKDIGYKMKILDIGGGFAGHLKSYEIFDKHCYSINAALERYFPENEDIQIIAEPGTYFVCSAFTLCANIAGKKVITLGEESGKFTEKREYFINDGMHNSFFREFEIFHVQVKPLKEIFEEGESKPLIPSKLWGITCDPGDVIKQECFLPEMNVGDYIIFRNMGAYSITDTSNFNGFPTPFIRYINWDEKEKINQTDEN